MLIACPRSPDGCEGQEVHAAAEAHGRSTAHERLPESVSESVSGDAVNDQSKVFEAILQPGDETVEKVNPIQLDMDMDGVTSANQTSTKRRRRSQHSISSGSCCEEYQARGGVQQSSEC